MEKILLGVLSFYVLYSYIETSAIPKTTTESFTLLYLEDRRIIPVRVELNTQQKTEHVSSIGGETLYDFYQGKVAYKDINSSQCFIADIIEESLEGDRRRLKSLQNGIIRGFYLPTFIVQEEINKEANLSKEFGIILTKFCNGNIVSLVTRQKHRAKRDTSEEKGQFTHHSYGHYGHQSNNYAHYGHETYVTGTVGKDGQIQNQRVSQHQVRSEGSQTAPGFRNGPHAFTRDSQTTISSPQSLMSPTHQRTLGVNGKNLGIGGAGQFSLQSTHEGGYQLNLPLGLRAGNTYQGGVRSSGDYGIGGHQPQIKTEYQKYPHSVYSGIYPSPSQAHFEQPPRTISPELPGIDRSKLGQRIPDSPDRSIERIPTHIQPGTSAPIAPVVTRDQPIQIPARAPGTQISHMQEHADKKIIPIHDMTGGQLIPPGASLPELPPSILHPGPSVSAPSFYIPSYEPGFSMPSFQMPVGMPGRISTRTPGTQITGPGLPPGPSILTPGLHIPSHQPGISTLISAPGQISTGTPGSQITSPSISVPSHQPEISMPFGAPGQISTRTPGSQMIGPSISAPGFTPSHQPEISMPSIQVPGRTIRIPGQTSTIPGTETFGMQPITGISRPSYQLSSRHPGLGHQQQYLPSRATPGQLQMPDISYPAGYDTHRDLKIKQKIPISTSSGYPSPIPEIYRPMPASTAPGIPHMVQPGSDQTIRNGIQYPQSSYPQTRTSTVDEHITGDASYVPGIPGYSKPTSDVGLPYLGRGTGPTSLEGITGYQTPTALRQSGRIPDSLPGLGSSSRGTASQLSQPVNGILTGQTRSESSRAFGQDSASSQTQIQTGLEGTAAGASSAGQYRGLGSQTQVQGGYAGNGSFSAQAQSGFTGGIVHSQVQGNKQSGLSSSSAQIERVGSAQSQVQVGQPSGSASSTAQGRFTAGITQVQAQSSKSGGSAGAQAQSTGLSSSHVQVNIGGKDAQEKESFQGTVSASVHGGHSMGQSQTQLQGKYESGRTYVATAQGGFDSSSGFQTPMGAFRTPLNQKPVGGQFSGIDSGFGIPTAFDIRQPTSPPDSAYPQSAIPDSPDSRPQLHTGLPMQEIPGLQRPDLQPALQTGQPLTSFPGHPQLHTQPGLQMQQIPESQRPGLQSISQTGQQQPLSPSFPGQPQLQPGLPMQQIPSLQPVSQTGQQQPLPPSFPGQPQFQPGLSMQHIPGLQPVSQTGHQQPLSPSFPGRPQLQPVLPMQQIPGLQPVSQTGQQQSLPPSFPGWSHIQPGLSMQQIPGLQPVSQTGQQQPLPPSFPGWPQLQPGLPMQQIPGLQPVSQTGQQQPLPPSFPGQPHIQPGLPMQQIPGLQPVSQTGQQQPLPPSFPGQSQLQPGLTMQQIPGFQPVSQTSQQQLLPPSSLGQPQLRPGLPMQQIPSLQPISQTGQQQPLPPSSLGQPQLQPGLPMQQIPSLQPVSQIGQQQPLPPSSLGQPQLQPGLPMQQIPSLQPVSQIGQQQPLPPSSLGQPQLRPGLPMQQIPGLQPVSASGQQQPLSPSFPVRPQLQTPTTPTPSVTPDTIQGLPGVSEPDRSNCCEALRDLKRRCCGRSIEPYHDGISPCCKSSQDDIFDFSSDNELDESKEPCKVVKAICYIVYKPVGKARICKPTATNAC